MIIKFSTLEPHYLMALLCQQKSCLILEIADSNTFFCRISYIFIKTSFRKLSPNFKVGLSWVRRLKMTSNAFMNTEKHSLKWILWLLSTCSLQLFNYVFVVLFTLGIKLFIFIKQIKIKMLIRSKPKLSDLFRIIYRDSHSRNARHFLKKIKHQPKLELQILFLCGN